MSTEKRLGIWMDHSNAHLMEYTDGKMNRKVIASSFTHQEKEESLSKSENLMHNKEQHHQGAYYKMLGEEIKKYDHVLLFGPTNAKAELMNTLKGDHHFDKIQIRVEQTDKLTDNQQHAFLRDYFLKSPTAKKS